MFPSSADAYKAIQDFNSSRPNTQMYTDQGNDKYGVSGLQSRVDALRSVTGNLETSIANVDPSVTGRTSGSLVTEAQRSALVNKEKQPLLTDYATANRNYSGAQQDLSQAQGLATNYANQLQSNDQTQYGRLMDAYKVANDRETVAAQTQADAAKQAEATREFNVSEGNKQANAAATSAADAAKGYSVKQLSSGNKAYTGPNGQTNLYQYAAALGGGDPTQTYNIIKQELATGSTTDKGAAAGIARLEKQGLPMDQIIARLKASNGYIFN